MIVDILSAKKVVRMGFDDICGVCNKGIKWISAYVTFKPANEDEVISCHYTKPSFICAACYKENYN